MSIPHIVTLSGPSLSGKTELSKLLQKDHGFNSVISVTTRPQRAQEVDGVDYYFIDEKEYSKLNLVQKTHFNGYHYGVSEKEIIGKKDAPILWVVAPGSIGQIEKYCQEHQYKITKIFVTNPDEVLFKRLFMRFKEDSMANTETYVKRLTSMTTTERGWVEDAHENIYNYDMVIKEFNEINTQDVINNVLAQVKEQKVAKKMKR